MALTIFTQVTQTIDAMGQNAVQNGFSGLATALGENGLSLGTRNVVSVMSSLLVLYVIVWGYQIWSGTARVGLVESTWRLLRAFLIYDLATNWSDFSTYGYALTNDIPNGVGNALMTALSNSGLKGITVVASPDASASALDGLVNTVYTSMTGIQYNSFFTFGTFIISWVFLLVVVVACIVALYNIVAAKIILWLLMILAPAFIILLLFQVSAPLFGRWVNGVIEYVLLQTLTYAMIALFVGMMTPTLAGLTTKNLWTLLPPAAVALIGVSLFKSLAVLAGQLAGFASASAGLGSIGGLFRMMTNPYRAVQSVRSAAGNARDWNGAKKLGVTTAAYSQGRQSVQANAAARQYQLTPSGRALAEKLKNSGQTAGSGPGTGPLPA